jgi:hypothetical protein
MSSPIEAAKAAGEDWIAGSGEARRNSCGEEAWHIPALLHRGAVSKRRAAVSKRRTDLGYTILMTRKFFLLFTLLAACAMAQNRVYELRTYHCNEGKLETLKARFRDHTIEIFKRHGIESIGYWVPQDPETSKNTLIYLIVHPSRADAAKNWAAFSSDPEWKKVAADSEKDGKIVNKVDSVFLDPTDFSQLK